MSEDVGDSKVIPKGSLGFRALSIVRNSKYLENNFSETGCVTIFR
jgi:hypothetical protein